MDNFLKDQFGVTEYKGQPVVSSRYVAEVFKKRHDNVLQSITDLKNQVSKNFTEPKLGLSEDFFALNFEEKKYKDSTGRKLPEYLLTRDGFTLLAMGFTGEKAMRFKIDYITRFNQMEQFIKSLSQTKLEFPEFTSAILVAHEEPKHYHFSNEINMINRIVLGTDAKGFKTANNIPLESPSIRPYLSLLQIKGIEALQRYDIGLIVTHPVFEERKQILSNYFNRLQTIKLLKAN